MANWFRVVYLLINKNGRIVPIRYSLATSRTLYKDTRCVVHFTASPITEKKTRKKAPNLGVSPRFPFVIGRIFASADQHPAAKAINKRLQPRPLSEDAAALEYLIRLLAVSAAGRRSLDAKMRPVGNRNLGESPKLGVSWTP